jgi:hypothetical protein
MNDRNHHIEHGSALKSWLVIFSLLALILGKGFFSFFVVSDLGQPSWDYRPILDVPAESPYAVYQLLPHPQHVRGAQGE